VLKIKFIRITLLILLLSTVFGGCGDKDIKSVDNAEITSVITEYYNAANSYDLTLVKATFSAEGWAEEKIDLSAWINESRSTGFSSEFISLESIKFEGDYIWAEAKIVSDLGEGNDYFCLVPENGKWKIQKLLTQKPCPISQTETETPDSSCCQ